MTALTIRNVPPELAQALQRERSRRGRSLNQTVIDLLEQQLGVAGVRSNGLGRLAGAWSEDEAGRFDADTAGFERVDDELWR